MKRIQFIILAASLVTSVASCKKWLDINTDPANPQIGTAEVLLPPIQYQMANGPANDYRFLFKTIQNWGSQSADNNWEAHGYEPGNDNGGTIWRMTYVNLGPNLELMISDGKQKGKWTYAGIGYAIKAWAYQLTTDLHGPIILDQALDTTRLFFNYQDQPEVYARVREWCDSAIACLGRPDAIDYSGILAGVTGDQIYKGDRSKWKKFTYAVLAQQYSHLTLKSKFKTEYADSVIKYVDLSFANASEDATVFFNGSTSSDANIFSPANSGLITVASTAPQQFTGRITQPIVNMLTGGVRGTPTTNPTTSTDPRLTRMIPANPDGVYRGVIPTFGDPASTKRIPYVLGSVSAPYSGKYLYYDKARWPIMSYSQLQFAKAEALYIKEDKPNAYTAYINGIKGHMDFINQYGINNQASAKITDPEINTYIASSEVAQMPDDLSIADIMTQKYIAQWGWAGMETFNDLRKYNYNINVFKQLYQYLPEDLYSTNQGNLCFRYRPRWNSEYVWNRTELAKWKALDPQYNTYRTWAFIPD